MTSDYKVSKKMSINKVFIAFCFISLSLYTQTNEIFEYNRKNLSNAYRFYNMKNYKKAAELFEYEIENSPILRIEYFENLANSYMNLKDYNNILNEHLLDNHKVEKGEVLFPRLDVVKEVDFIKGLMGGNK